jgi:transposase
LPIAIGSADIAARFLEPKAQSIIPVEPVDPLVVHEPSLPAQQDVDAEVAVLSGIVFVNRNGLRWCDAPKDYGPHKTL